jgi:hypothetical protein
VPVEVGNVRTLDVAAKELPYIAKQKIAIVLSTEKIAAFGCDLNCLHFISGRMFRVSLQTKM